MPLLQAARSCASLLFNLNLFMSSCTHSCQVFLPLPLPLTPSTTKLLHAETQSVGSLRSTCPYHLSLPRLTTSEIPSMPKRLNNSSLLFLSRSVTPHINLTIIHGRPYGRARGGHLPPPGKRKTCNTCTSWPCYYVTSGLRPTCFRLDFAQCALCSLAGIMIIQVIGLPFWNVFI